MDNGLTARYLIDPEDGPSSRQACPKGVYVVLTAALPDDAQTICAVPLGHNTVPQDCAKILEERTIRPSYYDRGDDTWIPSGFLLSVEVSLRRHQSASSGRNSMVPFARDGADMLERLKVWRDGDGYKTNICAGVVVHEATCTHQGSRRLWSVWLHV